MYTGQILFELTFPCIQVGISETWQYVHVCVIVNGAKITTTYLFSN